MLTEDKKEILNLAKYIYFATKVDQMLKIRNFRTIICVLPEICFKKKLLSLCNISYSIQLCIVHFHFDCRLGAMYIALFAE